MLKDDPRPGDFESPDGIDSGRRALGKSAAWLLLAGAWPFGGVRALSAWNGAEPSVPPWGDPATLVSSIGAGTLAVADVAETVDAYTKGFEYIETWRGRIPEKVANFWGAPAMAGRAMAVVGPPDYTTGLIRIVELGEDFKEVPYHETLGWIALEIRVQSPDDLVARLEGSGLPFVHTGGPGTFSMSDGTPVYRAAQFKGPSGEPLYMTQHMQLDQLVEVGRTNVGGLFIQTLGARPYLPTRDFYQSLLKMKSRMEIDTPRTNLVEAFGLPGDRKYKMAAVRMTDYCSIQIDEYPEPVPARAAVDGCVVPGVCMSTLIAKDLGVVAQLLRDAGLAFEEMDGYPIPPASGGRALVCRGYSGEVVEFVQA